MIHDDKVIIRTYSNIDCTPIMFGTDVRKLVEDEQTDELVEVYG